MAFGRVCLPGPWRPPQSWSVRETFGSRTGLDQTEACSFVIASHASSGYVRRLSVLKATNGQNSGHNASVMKAKPLACFRARHVLPRGEEWTAGIDDGRPGVQDIVPQGFGVLVWGPCFHGAPTRQSAGGIVGRNAGALSIAVAGKAVPVAVPGVCLLADHFLVYHRLSRHITLQ